MPSSCCRRARRSCPAPFLSSATARSSARAICRSCLPGEEHELGFGVDDLVRVRHSISEEKRGETGLISTSRTDSRNFKISVKSMHERAIALTVFDQIPASENQDIKVELLARTAPTKQNVDDKRGVLVWELKLEPDQEQIIEFGYRVSWPSAKSIVYGR